MKGLFRKLKINWTTMINNKKTNLKIIKGSMPSHAYGKAIYAAP